MTGERCVTWHCARMDWHITHPGRKPCPRCYSVEQLRRNVPYQHSGRFPIWSPADGFVDPPPADGQLDLFEGVS